MLLSEEIGTGSRGLILESGMKPAIITMNRGTRIEADHLAGPFRGQRGTPFYVAGLRYNPSWRFLAGDDVGTLGKTGQGSEFVSYAKLPERLHVNSLDPEGDRKKATVAAAAEGEILSDVDDWGHDHGYYVKFKVKYMFEEMLTINPNNIANVQWL